MTYFAAPPSTSSSGWNPVRTYEITHCPGCVHQLSNLITDLKNTMFFVEREKSIYRYHINHHKLTQLPRDISQKSFKTIN